LTAYLLLKFTVPEKCNYYQNQGSPPSGIGDFSYPFTVLWMLLLRNTIKLFGFSIFRFERNWWRLFQTLIVRNKFDISRYC